MKKGALIGKGRSAEVYEWGESQALKLYYEGYRPEWVTYEAEMGRIVAEAGVPAPSVFDKVDIEGRTGLVYERITGPSMLRQVQSAPFQLTKCARDMAQLQHATHSCTTSLLPPQKKSWNMPFSMQAASCKKKRRPYARCWIHFRKAIPSAMATFTRTM